MQLNVVLGESLLCSLRFCSSSLLLCVLQYLNRGCTRFFASKDTDKQILQNRKSPEVKYRTFSPFLSFSEANSATATFKKVPFLLFCVVPFSHIKDLWRNMTIYVMHEHNVHMTIWIFIFRPPHDVFSFSLWCVKAGAPLYIYISISSLEEDVQH